MFTKCPRCKERQVLEREVAYLTWERSCQDCGFVFTVSANIKKLDLGSKDTQIALLDAVSPTVTLSRIR
jgi:ribosomal protein L37AE/L43A